MECSFTHLNGVETCQSYYTGEVSLLVELKSFCGKSKSKMEITVVLLTRCFKPLERSSSECWKSFGSDLTLGVVEVKRHLTLEFDKSQTCSRRDTGESAGISNKQLACGVTRDKCSK